MAPCPRESDSLEASNFATGAGHPATTEDPVSVTEEYPNAMPYSQVTLRGAEGAFAKTRTTLGVYYRHPYRRGGGPRLVVQRESRSVDTDQQTLGQ